jgi:hypothetical protein
MQIDESDWQVAKTRMAISERWEWPSKVMVERLHK